MNYAESEDEDDEEVFKPNRARSTRGRALKRWKTVVNDEEDFFENDDDLLLDERTCSLLLSSVLFLISS